MKKIDSLQSLRALAFLGIFTSHTMWNSQYGAWGVCVFFVLSGFLMTYNYHARDLDISLKGMFAFSVGKLKKLYLLHLITLIFGIPFEVDRSLNNGTIGTAYMFKKIFASLTLLESWSPDFWIYGSFNGVAWFLSACGFIYFVFPLILKLLKRVNSTKLIVVLLMVVYFAQAGSLYLTRATAFSTYPDTNYWIAYTCPLIRAGDFIMGCLMGKYFLCQGDKSVSKALASIVELCTFILIYISGRMYVDPTHFWGQNWYRYTCLWIPTACVLVYVFAISKGVITKLLCNKLFIGMGNISQYAFLWHSLLILYFNQAFSYLFTTYPEIINEINKIITYDSNVFRVIITTVSFTLTIILSILWKYLEDTKKKQFKTV